jgi:site-specific recombinase XerD
MKGCRPLDTNEIIKISEQFDGTFEIRNRSLFLLGVSVGGRISELLALRIEDVWQNHQPVSDLLFQKRMVKGRETARMIPVNADGQQAIYELIQWHLKRYFDLDPQRPLFPSRKFSAALSRSQAHRILEKAFRQANLNGKLATHSLRKTFAQRLYDASGDIFLVQELLGHKSVETTQAYLGVSYKKMQQATEAIEIHNRSMKTLHSMTEISTGDFITEMMSRGLDVSSIINQLQDQRLETESKVIPFPKRA